MKNILLAVCGLSPQVITEALYALHQEGRRVDAIDIITTRDGKDIINAQLLSPGDGHYYRYLQDYKIDPGRIAFHAGHVHTITDGEGREIYDIVDEEDNEYVLKKCLELTFELTSDPQTALFFLVAGGRKTMTSCLTLAAQLYGRPQDRIYHVLVSPEFESNRDFFYPPPVPVTIGLRDHKGEPYAKSTSYARVNLIPLPFVSIRSRLSSGWLKTPRDPATLMLSLIREPKPVLTVNLPETKLIYKGIELDLQPAHMAIYFLFALQKIDCRRQVTSCGTCRQCFLSVQDVFARQGKVTELYKHIVKNDLMYLERPDSRIHDLGHEAFNQYKSKIKRKILQAFGPYVLPKLEISSIGRKPDTKYGIALDKRQIRIVL